MTLFFHARWSSGSWSLGCLWSSKIDFKPRILFGTLRKRIFHLWLVKSRTLFGTHRKRTCWVRLTLSVALCLPRSGNTRVKWGCLKFRTLLVTHIKHVSSKIDFNTRTLFGTHRIAHVKKDWMQVSHLIRCAQKRICKQDCIKSRTLFGTYRKRTCRVRLTSTLVLYSTSSKRICQVRLNTSLVP